MNKTNIRVAVGILIVLVVLFGSNTTLFKKSNTDSTNEIKLGSILILSGEGASWGEASKNGIDLAVKEINQQGGIDGKKLTVAHEDNMSDPSRAISAFRKLTTSDEVKYIIGPNWSNSGIPLVKLADQTKTVVISPTLGLKEFNEGSPYLFNTWPHDDLLSRNLADYVYNKGYRNVAVFGAQDVWNKQQTQAFSERFLSLGGKIALTYEPTVDTKDVRAEVLKVKNNKNIDALIMTNSSFSLIDITAIQLRDLKVNLPMFSITVDQKLISECKGACDGMTFLTFLTPTSDFEEKYKAAYNGREVEIGADSAYDAVMMLAEAMKATHSTDTEKVSAYLSSLKTYGGSSGNLISDGKRGFTKPYVIKKVVDGKQVEVKE
ncbi:MAG: penicillin-binding protein activator [Candidatus Pacebacteria bacterium]|nr:penicillin-binding protein activator [Candidatus Paceibacterota bacterium]